MFLAVSHYSSICMHNVLLLSTLLFSHSVTAELQLDLLSLPDSPNQAQARVVPRRPPTFTGYIGTEARLHACSER